jgi:hypothetical protein
MPYHLIFEGAELSGKSWVMSQIYNELEPKYAVNANVLDGCYWLNCDLGFFGTELAPAMIKNYLAIFKTLEQKNILSEKFLLSALVYSELYGVGKIARKKIEQKLKKMNFKIILLTFPEDQELIKKRLEDRLNLYPNYRRIAKAPEFYLKQQQLYKKYLAASTLDHLVLEVDKFPDQEVVDKIKKWLG